MKDYQQGFIIISSDLGPEGIVTEWDDLSKVIAEGADSSELTIGDIMSSGLIAIRMGGVWGTWLVS